MAQNISENLMEIKLQLEKNYFTEAINEFP